MSKLGLEMGRRDGTPCSTSPSTMELDNHSGCRKNILLMRLIGCARVRIAQGFAALKPDIQMTKETRSLSLKEGPQNQEF